MLTLHPELWMPTPTCWQIPWCNGASWAMTPEIAPTDHHFVYFSLATRKIDCGPHVICCSLLFASPHMKRNPTQTSVITSQTFSFTLLLLRNSVAMEVVAMMASTRHLQLKKKKKRKCVEWREQKHKRDRDKCMSGGGIRKGNVCVWTRASTKEGGSGCGGDGTTVSTLLFVKSFRFGLYGFTGDRAQTSFL